MFKNRRKFRLMDQAGDGTDGKGASGAAADDSNQNGNTGETGGAKPSDSEAKLLKEVMKNKEALKAAKEEARVAAEAAKELQTKLAQFDGIDLAKVKDLMTAEARRAEEEALKRGEFEKVRQQMVEQHNAEVERIRKEAETKIAELSGTLTGATSTITELTIGRAFGESNFVREELTLTPSKARVVYGGHFEVQNGKVVAYDKPAGATDRTILVDGSGQPLDFEAALTKLVNADPDKDHLIRSKVKPGAGSSTDDGGKGAPKVASDLTGRDRIAAALSGKPLFGKK